MKDSENYHYNNFTYKKDYSKPHIPIEIEHTQTPPENIFKFYSLSEYNLDALIKGYFYSSHPLELNDILDSSVFLWYTSKPLDFKYYQKLLGDEFKDNPEELIQYYKEDCNSDKRCQNYIFNYWQVLTNLMGIISTTGKENNPLMWPHYTQEKGFQIKFETKELEKSIKDCLEDDEEYLGLYPMNYTNTIKPIDISQFKQMFIPLFYATNIKLDNWKYEDEWRFLVGKKNMGIPYSKAGFSPKEDYFVKAENRFTYYDPKLIKAITVGMNFFNGKDFDIKQDEKENFLIKISTEKKDEYENLDRFMNHITTYLNDKFYYSGVKLELNEKEELYLIRTKERLEIYYLDDGWYKIIRTDEVVRFLDDACL